MLIDADMTAVELVFLASSVCNSQLKIASDPFQHFIVNVSGDDISIIPVKK